MLKISRLADYAILLLWQFTHQADADDAHQLHQSRPLNASFLAQKTSIPQTTVQKILKLLHQGGLLISKRGIQGGYLLAQSPANISLKHILNAIEGPIHLTSCISDTHDCSIINLCPLSSIWQDLNQKFEDILDDTSLDQMRPALFATQNLGYSPKEKAL